MNGTEFARISGSYSTAYIATYEVLSQSTSGNSTTFRLYGYFYYGGGTSVGSATGNGFYLDGTYISSGNYRYYPGYTQLGTKDITVTHNNDGSFPGRNVGISASSYHMSGSTSGNIYANNINRQATVTSATDFNDEGNPTIKYSNPGGFRINARLEFAGSIIRRDNIANTGSYTFNLTDEERKLIRQKCTGNSMTVREVIATCISGETESFWSWQDKTMTIINANPEFNNFEFEDINEKTIALTGNNQNIIKGYSNVQVTIPIIDKGTAKKEATMNKYRFTCGDKSSDIIYSDTEDVNGTISGVPNGTFTVYATDSRNNSTPVQKLANEAIDYIPLTKGNIDIFRNNGVSEEVTLQLDGTIDERDFGLVINSIKSAIFRYKTTEVGSKWSDGEEIALNVNDGRFSFDGLVAGDLESKGFNISNSYQIEVEVKDELSTVIFTDTFGSGIPNLALAKNGVGIMGKYNDEVGGKGQVAGNPLAYYPIGAIYISVSDITPDELFGGTWEKIKGRFLLATGTPDGNTDNYFGDMSGIKWSPGLGSTGGQDYHKLTVDEMPAHKHDINFDQIWHTNGGQASIGTTTGGPYNGVDFTKNTGGGKQHNNMPPYLAVNMWKRIS